MSKKPTLKQILAHTTKASEIYNKKVQEEIQSIHSFSNEELDKYFLNCDYRSEAIRKNQTELQHSFYYLTKRYGYVDRDHLRSIKFRNGGFQIEFCADSRKSAEYMNMFSTFDGVPVKRIRVKK